MFKDFDNFWRQMGRRASQPVHARPFTGQCLKILTDFAFKSHCLKISTTFGDKRVVARPSLSTPGPSNLNQKSMFADLGNFWRRTGRRSSRPACRGSALKKCEKMRFANVKRCENRSSSVYCSHFIESIYKVNLQQSIPTQIRQLVLHYY